MNSEALRVNLTAPGIGRARLVRRARTLSWLSIAWMAVEAAVGVSAALIAGSVALLGFGLDSVIELASASTILWRFTSNRAHSEHAERRAQQLIAGCFVALAVYLAFDAITTLADSSRPEMSWPGLAVSAAAIVLMPLLARAKQQVAIQLDSAATAGDAAQSRLCALIATGALLSILANTVVGWWWLDPIIGLAIAAIATLEAREAWAGETCADCTPIGFDDHCANSEHRLT